MVTGEAAGVPFVAVEPSGGARPDAPVVVIYHLLGAPWNERAMAAALPLEGLDAWRFYLGLPLAGSRMPGGSMDTFMQVAFSEPVMNMHDVVNRQSADEFPAALAALRERFGLDADAPLCVLGGSAGGGVAAEVVTRAGGAVTAAVLVNAGLRLRPVVAALGRQFGVDYRWTPESEAVADRIDYVARAAELGTTPIRLIIGADDEVDAFRTPAHELSEAVAGPSDVAIVEHMAHTLADEPGVEPAPQTPHAAQVDALAVDWFRHYLEA